MSGVKEARSRDELLAVWGKDNVILEVRDNGSREYFIFIVNTTKYGTTMMSRREISPVIYRNDNTGGRLRYDNMCFFKAVSYQCRLPYYIANKNEHNMYDIDGNALELRKLIMGDVMPSTEHMDTMYPKEYVDRIYRLETTDPEYKGFIAKLGDTPLPQKQADHDDVVEFVRRTGMGIYCIDSRNTAIHTYIYKHHDVNNTIFLLKTMDHFDLLYP